MADETRYTQERQAWGSLGTGMGEIRYNPVARLASGQLVPLGDMPDDMAHEQSWDDTAYRQACTQLSAQLRELRRQVGRPSLDRIVTWGKKKMPDGPSMSKSTVSDILSGKRAPASLDRLLWLVQALMNFQDGREVEPPKHHNPALFSTWRQLWDIVEDGRAAQRAPKTAPSEPPPALGGSVPHPFDSSGRGGGGGYPSEFLPKESDQ
ncbi:helix-turn-helix domain-containing protein [Streptomyces sporangiiformans]|uniref:Uncharacterized protein n=1 Tax=Streptomyces sporangiiformans TaxID=2315329 RepID=A0A505DHH5_9ACTN|nr:helix-turn-helix transcriptional regulator [Streptomyces sporangiiformans]TPQ22697.1 hypothetical protein FGD71_008565 [Streptomyces sporangiiformans]